MWSHDRVRLEGPGKCRICRLIPRSVLDGLFVAYYRVSTQQQGRSGLGLAAQQEAVRTHVASVAGELVDAFEEVETGKLNSRPALARALDACRAMHAT